MTGSKLVIVALAVMAIAAGVFSAGGASAGGNSGPVAAGGSFSCAVTQAGGAKCWGANESGQLGNGLNEDSPVPVNVTGLTSGVSSITGGLNFACALMTSGGVKCWGRNAARQLGVLPTGSCGDPAVPCSRTPVDVTGLSSGVTAISAGQAHVCALMATGGVKCWGSNSNGQLGNGDSTGTSSTPIDVDIPGGATAIATSALFSCALTTSGGVKCWGDNTFGQLGDGTADERDTPTQVTGLESGVISIGTGGAASAGHTCAGLAAGGAKCWGNNEYGQLGDNREQCDPRPPVSQVCSTPLVVHNLTGEVTAISGGYLFTCAIVDGAAKCWGANDWGQLGDNLTCGNLCAEPVSVTGLSAGVTNIATGSSHACARTAAAVRCWGISDHGQVGDGGDCGTTCPTALDVVGLSGIAGDVNCDQTVNSIDAALVLQFGAGLLHSLSCASAADTNHDGNVNSIDAALILQFGAGLLHALP